MRVSHIYLYIDEPTFKYIPNLYYFYDVLEQSPWMSVDDRRGLPGTELIRPRPSLPSVPVHDPNVGSVLGTDGELPSRPNPG